MTHNTSLLDAAATRSSRQTAFRPSRPLRVCRLGGSSRRRRHARGIAIIWMALMLVLLIGITGLMIDLGYSLLVAHQLQNAADAAALAGVQKVRGSAEAARLAAINFAQANIAAQASVLLADNPGNAIDGDVVIGRYNRSQRLFEPTLAGPNAVKVVARLTANSLNGALALFFGPVFGVATVDISRHAIAMIGGGTGAGIIALNPTERNALTISGTVTVNTGDGAIQVNSSNSTAVFVNGTPVLNTTALNVVGEPRMVGDYDLQGELNTGVPFIPDPLAWLPEPTWDEASDLGEVRISGGEDMTIGPGYYSGGILINNGSLTLDPGIYILDGEGLNISGTATFLAEGVMFYIIGTGVVDLTGANTVRITPPDPELYSYPGVDTYERVSIFQARDNTNESRIIGTSLMDLEGTLYFPSAKLNLGGTGEGFGNQLIADMINIFGTGEMLINYDGNEPAVGNKIFLVE